MRSERKQGLGHSQLDLIVRFQRKVEAAHRIVLQNLGSLASYQSELNAPEMRLIVMALDPPEAEAFFDRASQSFGNFLNSCYSMQEAVKANLPKTRTRVARFWDPVESKYKQLTGDEVSQLVYDLRTISVHDPPINCSFMQSLSGVSGELSIIVSQHSLASARGIVHDVTKRLATGAGRIGVVDLATAYAGRATDFVEYCFNHLGAARETALILDRGSDEAAERLRAELLP